MTGCRHIYVDFLGAGGGLHPFTVSLTYSINENELHLNILFSIKIESLILYLTPACFSHFSMSTKERLSIKLLFVFL